MPESPESEIVSGIDIRTLEASLERLWERARRVSELLTRLKEENVALKGRVHELEMAEKEMKVELRTREQEFERLRSELLKLQSNGSQVFTNDEKEALKARIKELIAKINSRL